MGKLDVKYQWKPPQCSHCKTFGHSTELCKVRPRTEAEIAVKNNKDDLFVNDQGQVKSNVVKKDEDGFVTVGKNNKPVSGQYDVHLNKQKSFVNNRTFQGKNSQSFNRFPNGNVRQRSGNFGNF